MKQGGYYIWSRALHCWPLERSVSLILLAESKSVNTCRTARDIKPYNPCKAQGGPAGPGVTSLIGTLQLYYQPDPWTKGHHGCILTSDFQENIEILCENILPLSEFQRSSPVSSLSTDYHLKTKISYSSKYLQGKL